MESGGVCDADWFKTATLNIEQGGHIMKGGPPKLTQALKLSAPHITGGSSSSMIPTPPSATPEVAGSVGEGGGGIQHRRRCESSNQLLGIPADLEAARGSNSNSGRSSNDESSKAADGPGGGGQGGSGGGTDGGGGGGGSGGSGGEEEDARGGGEGGGGDNSVDGGAGGSGSGGDAATGLKLDSRSGRGRHGSNSNGSDGSGSGSPLSDPPVPKVCNLLKCLG